MAQRHRENRAKQKDFVNPRKVQGGASHLMVGARVGLMRTVIYGFPPVGALALTAGRTGMYKHRMVAMRTSTLAESADS